MSRCCIHTMTTKPWSLDDCARHYPAAGVGGITVWRQHLAGHDIAKAGQNLRGAGLEIISLCRGGFFPSPLPPAARQQLMTTFGRSTKPMRWVRR